MSDDNYTQRIKRLKRKMIPNVGVVVFTGCTGSGKTVAMINVMHTKRHYFDQVIVMSGSQETCEDFARHVPPICIFNNFDENRLARIYKQQELDRAQGKMRPILIVLDDLMYLHKYLKKSTLLTEIFMNGRHAGILLFISMQYCKSLTPDFRSQVKIAFIGADKSPENRKKVFEAFNTVFHSFNDFDSCMRSCTKNYKMMVLPKTNVSSDVIEENVFWFKGKKERKFKMCRKGLLWSINQIMFDPEHVVNQLKQAQELHNAGQSKTGRGRGRGGGGKFTTI
jgi:hypothetical protein